MNTKYKFLADDFAINDQKLLLLRNRYCYRKISFSEIEGIQIEKDFHHKRWIFLLIFGILLISCSIYFLVLFWALYNQEFFNSDSPELKTFLNSSVIKSFGVYFIIVFFLSLYGFFAIVSALGRAYVLKIVVHGRRYHLSLQSIVKQNQLFQLIQYLNSYGFTSLKDFRG